MSSEVHGLDPQGLADEESAELNPPGWLVVLESRVARLDLQKPLVRLLGRSTVTPGVQDPFVRAAGGPAILTFPLMFVLGLLTLPASLSGLHSWLPFVVPAVADAAAAVLLALSLRVRATTGTLTSAGRAERRLVGCISALLSLFSLTWTPVIAGVAAVAVVLLLWSPGKAGRQR